MEDSLGRRRAAREALAYSAADRTSEVTYPTPDSSDNPTQTVVGANETDYTYDVNSRLDDATYPGLGTVDYNYDWVGNRDNPPADPNGLVFNGADQLTAWPGQHQYTYFPTGSLYEQRDSTGTTVEKEYAYTPANLLSTVTHRDQGNVVSSMIWDTDGNRVGFTSSGGGYYNYVYDITAGIPAVIDEVTPDGSVYYVREPAGDLIARVSGVTGQGTRYYHFDALGSTRLLTDGSGTVTDTYSYDAWGNVTDHTGESAQPYQFVGQLGYYTHVQDPNLPLLQFGVRFYDPETGRFTQIDSVDSLYPYAYTRSRPVTLTDEWGLYPKFLDCTPDQVKQLKKHIDDILKHRLSCITGGKKLRNCIEGRLRNNGFIRCGSQPGEPPCTGCGYTDNPTPRKHIHICPDAFDSNKCGCLGRTIIHEFAHSCTTDLPGEDPEGYQCEHDCYGKGKPACPK